MYYYEKLVIVVFKVMRGYSLYEIKKDGCFYVKIKIYVDGAIFKEVGCYFFFLLNILNCEY